MMNVEPSEAAAAWRLAVDRQLNKRDGARTLVSRTLDGIPIGPLHPKADVAPGPWRDATTPVRVFARADHPDAGAANALAQADVRGGANGLTLTFAGAAAARGFGLAADALDDVLTGLPLDGLDLRLEFAPHADVSSVRRVSDVLLRRMPAGSAIDFGLDPLGDMARWGAAPLPWRDLGRKLASDFGTLRADGLGVGPFLRADGRVHHEAGASDAQELAAVLSTALAYLRGLEPSGLADARHAIGFTLAADADQFATVAKLRALRVLWREVERACGLDPKPLRLHAETAWRMVTRRDPHANLVRGAIACAGAVMGGADTIGTLPFTAALGLADGFARRLARNTALVLLREAHLGRVADPAAGSGTVEHLTGALCDCAWSLMQAVERDGGLAATLERGAWQARVAAMRDARRTAVANGASPIVGTTAFAAPSEIGATVLPVTPERSVSPEWAAGAPQVPALLPTRDAEPVEREYAR